MASTITAGNATNGAAINSDNTGILEFKTGTGAGTTALTLNASQNATFAGTLGVGAVTSTGLVTGATGALYPIVSGTAITLTNQTAPDLSTSIPSWVKRITVMFRAVQTNGAGTARILLQVGSGSYSTSGYTSYAGVFTGTNVTGTASNTTGILVTTDMGNASLISGHLILTLVENNQWVSSHTLGGTDAASSVVMRSGGGFTPNLSGALDRVRLNTTNGTDQFDGGTINILWE